MINIEAFEARIAELESYSFIDRYATVLLNMADLYAEIEYVDPVPLVRDIDVDSTLLTSSGIQFMNQFINGDKPAPSHAFLISQPVVRMNYLPTVALGSYTNFVNFGTMQFGLTPKDHARISDEYRDVLSEATGMDVTTVGVQDDLEHFRNGMEYTTFHKNYVVDGLEVADSLFHEIVLPDGTNITMSELGGGLERLLFGRSPAVIQETTDISAVDSTNIEAVDAFRGAVLIAGNNVQPSNNNQGYQLRRLLKRLPNTSSDLQEFIDSLIYSQTPQSYWQSMGGAQLPSEETADTVRKELWRNVNLAALSRAGVKSKSKMDLAMDPEAFSAKFSLGE